MSQQSRSKGKSAARPRLRRVLQGGATAGITGTFLLWAGLRISPAPRVAARLVRGVYDASPKFEFACVPQALKLAVNLVAVRLVDPVPWVAR